MPMAITVTSFIQKLPLVGNNKFSNIDTSWIRTEWCLCVCVLSKTKFKISDADRYHEHSKLKFYTQIFISILAYLQTGGQYKHQDVRLTARIGLHVPSATGIKWRRISQTDVL